MEFLGDILGEMLTQMAVSIGLSIESKKVLIYFGLVMLVPSLCLSSYFRSLPQVKVEDYYLIKLDYSLVCCDVQDKCPNIILFSDSRKYRINHEIWQENYSHEAIIEGLGEHHRAKIWLKSPDSLEIKGIETSSLSIEPSLGIAWDNKNIKSGETLGWLFVGLSSLLIVVTSLSYYTAKYEEAQRRKPKWWI